MSSKDDGMYMTEEDAASVRILHEQARALQGVGLHEDAWKCNGLARSIVNRATVQALASGNVVSNEKLYYIDGPAKFAQVSEDNKGVEVTLMLLDGSPLARAVIRLLQIDQDGNGT